MKLHSKITIEKDVYAMMLMSFGLHTTFRNTWLWV